MKTESQEFDSLIDSKVLKGLAKKCEEGLLDKAYAQNAWWISKSQYEWLPDDAVGKKVFSQAYVNSDIITHDSTIMDIEWTFKNFEEGILRLLQERYRSEYSSNAGSKAILGHNGLQFGDEFKKDLPSKNITMEDVQILHDYMVRNGTGSPSSMILMVSPELYRGLKMEASNYPPPFIRPFLDWDAKRHNFIGGEWKEVTPRTDDGRVNEQYNDAQTEDLVIFHPDAIRFRKKNPDNRDCPPKEFVGKISIMEIESKDENTGKKSVNNSICFRASMGEGTRVAHPELAYVIRFKRTY